jgi:hypothetical protein
VAGATGTDVLFFGGFDGGNYASVAVTGQSAITTSSHCEAFLMFDTTADHNGFEHLLSGIRLVCGDRVAGVGFTIHAYSDMRLTGTFQVHWVWAD